MRIIEAQGKLKDDTSKLPGSLIIGLVGVVFRGWSAERQKSFPTLAG